VREVSEVAGPVYLIYGVVPEGVSFGDLEHQPGSSARPATGTPEQQIVCAGPCPHTRAMTEEEIRERVKEILLKRDRGDDLTSQEETILAYAYYAAGEQALRIWVRPDIETGE
jgi:hypothetical protein